MVDGDGGVKLKSFMRAALGAVILLAGCGESVPTPLAPPPPPAPREEPDANDVRARWLAENAVSVRSVDPADEDWTDLEPFGAAIGDARIVLLGEQSHGDGTTFLAKTRLIKYLHQERGFDVLAFESGLFDLRKAWQLMQEGMSARNAMQISIFPIWTGSDQFQDLMDYVGEAAGTSVPLELAGVDVQFTGVASTEYLTSELQSFLISIGSSVLEGLDGILASNLLQALVEHRWTQPGLRPSLLEQEFLRSVLLLARQDIELRVDAGNSEASFWLQMLKSIEQAAILDALFDPDVALQIEQGAIRDRQMADNLLWLAQSNPERKIIVWAATFHEVRNVKEIEVVGQPGFYDEVETMGNVAWQALGSEMYTVGFTASEGTHGIWWNAPRRLDPPALGSFESLMNGSGATNAVVDFRSLAPGGEWLDELLVSRPLGYGEMLAVWPRHIDGMFFTRTMEPSTQTSR